MAITPTSTLILELLTFLSITVLIVLRFSSLTSFSPSASFIQTLRSRSRAALTSDALLLLAWLFVVASTGLTGYKSLVWISNERVGAEVLDERLMLTMGQVEGGLKVGVGVLWVYVNALWIGKAALVAMYLMFLPSPLSLRGFITGVRLRLIKLTNDTGCGISAPPSPPAYGTSSPQQQPSQQPPTSPSTSSASSPASPSTANGISAPHSAPPCESPP